MSPGIKFVTALLFITIGVFTGSFILNRLSIEAMHKKKRMVVAENAYVTGCLQEALVASLYLVQKPILRGKYLDGAAERCLVKGENFRLWLEIGPTKGDKK